MPANFKLTEGFGVEIDGIPTMEEGIHMIADCLNHQKNAIAGRSNAYWVMARLILGMQEILGQDFFYQALDENISPYTVNLALKTAKEFSPEEVAEFPDLYYSHFAEVTKKARLSHEERMALLKGSQDGGYSVRETRERADIYIHGRDGSEPKRKPKYLVVGVGNAHLSLDGEGFDGDQVFTLGQKPKRVTGFEVDGDPILEELTVEH